jgi:hypothetical protein
MGHKFISLSLGINDDLHRRFERGVTRPVFGGDIAKPSGTQKFHLLWGNVVRPNKNLLILQLGSFSVTTPA